MQKLLQLQACCNIARLGEGPAEDVGTKAMEAVHRCLIDGLEQTKFSAGFCNSPFECSRRSLGNGSAFVRA